MLKALHLSDETKTFLAWQWCLSQEREKRKHPDECKKYYELYKKILQQNKNKNNNNNN